MKKYILIRFNRYEAAKSEVMNHYTYEHNLGLAFKEVLRNLWEGQRFEEEDKSDIWDWERMKGYENKIGMDFEEESYLFWEDKVKLENIK